MVLGLDVAVVYLIGYLKLGFPWWRRCLQGSVMLRERETTETG